MFRVSFDNLIILLILISSFAMGLQSCDLQPASRLAIGLSYLDLLSTAIFVTEMLAKMVTLGLINGKHAVSAAGLEPSVPYVSHPQLTRSCPTVFSTSPRRGIASM